MITPQGLFFAFIGGIFPALFWLWFWLKEDSLHDEPRGLILLTFLAGMLAGLLSLPFEKFFANKNMSIQATIFFWAIIEELFKFGAVYFIVLRKKVIRHTIDPMIYLITAALGFAALENSFFLINPILSGNIVESILTGNLRFVGASVLHIASSAIIGLTIALSFYSKKSVQRITLFFGIVLAIALHSLFNLFIISGNNTFVVFSAVWLIIVVLLILFEKAKKVHPSNITN